MQLLLYSDEAAAWYGDTVLALRLVGEAAAYNNEAIRAVPLRARELVRMTRIAARTGINILDSPARQLLREGVLRYKLRCDSIT